LWQQHNFIHEEVLPILQIFHSQFDLKFKISSLSTELSILTMISSQWYPEPGTSSRIKCLHGSDSGLIRIRS
ncbi:unnamed protein product, partial [Allacma fusca]